MAFYMYFLGSIIYADVLGSIGTSSHKVNNLFFLLILAYICIVVKNIMFSNNCFHKLM